MDVTLLERLGQYTDKNFDGYSGSVYIDTENNTYKVWLSKDEYIVNGSTSGNIEVVELSQVQPASTTCEDIEIIACTTDKYNLYINAMGGKFRDNMEKKSFELLTGATQEIEEPTKAEYTFNGWSIIGNPESFNNGILMIGKEDVMLSADWISNEASTHALYVNPDGGNWNNFTTTQEYGMEEYKTKLISNPIKFGFVFERWEVTGTPMSFDNGLLRMGEEDISLKAIWTPLYTYTGSSNLINDGDGNWRIKFLTSESNGSTFISAVDMLVDVFLVGGGGAGCAVQTNNGWRYGCAGGGGGYTITRYSKEITAGEEYTIKIGTGGTWKWWSVANPGTSSEGFGYKAPGGAGGGVNPEEGGSGGSGGSGGWGDAQVGGQNGGNGVGGCCEAPGGVGQGPTTCEFEQGNKSGCYCQTWNSDHSACLTYVTMYAGGGGGRGGAGGAGGGGYNSISGLNGVPNTGGGGAGVYGESGGNGGSGIVIIRNHRN